MSTSSSHLLGKAAATSSRLMAEIHGMQAVLREFYADDGERKHHPTADDKAAMRTFLSSDKTCSARPGQSDYLADHDAKLDLIPQVYAALDAADPGTPNLAQASIWAALWSMAATDVERLLGELRDPKQQIFISSALEAASHKIPPLLKIFRGLSRDDDADEAKTVYKRNRNMSRIALERDGKKCLLTGAPYPEVCHIFPFASLRYRSTMKTALVSMTTLWGKDRVTELLNRLSSAYAFGDTNMTNVVDTPKNMVTLNPQLHDWWGRGLFALEPLGEPKASDAQSATGTPTTSKKQKREEYTIQVRFHWLRPTDVRDLKSIVDFSQDPIAKLRIPDSNPPAAVNLQTWRPIENGQVFEIKANDLEELPDYEILLLQWDLLRMWRLAGGADPAVYSLEDDSDEELGVRGDEKMDEKMEETGGKDGQKDARSSPLPDRPFSSQRRRRTQRSSDTTVDSQQDPFDPLPYRPGSIQTRRRMNRSSETTVDSQPDPSDDACGIRMPTSMAQDPGDDPRSDEEDRI